MHDRFRTVLYVAAILWLCPLALSRDVAADPPRQVVQSPSTEPSAPPAPPPDTAPAGTPATVLDDQQVTAILGKSVRGREGEDMGRIVDVIVNRSGQVRAAVIDFGGFLGVGSRKIAVDWSALRFEATGKPDRITVDLTRNSVRLAPEYKEGTPVVVLGQPDAAASTAGGAARDQAKER